MKYNCYPFLKALQLTGATQPLLHSIAIAGYLILRLPHPQGAVYRGTAGAGYGS